MHLTHCTSPHTTNSHTFSFYTNKKVTKTKEWLSPCNPLIIHSIKQLNCKITGAMFPQGSPLIVSLCHSNIVSMPEEEQSICGGKGNFKTELPKAKTALEVQLFSPWCHICWERFSVWRSNKNNDGNELGSFSPPSLHLSHFIQSTCFICLHYNRTASKKLTVVTFSLVVSTPLRLCVLALPNLQMYTRNII